MIRVLLLNGADYVMTWDVTTWKEFYSGGGWQWLCEGTWHIMIYSVLAEGVIMSPFFSK
jgi:hypothetical protein